MKPLAPYGARFASPDGEACLGPDGPQPSSALTRETVHGEALQASLREPFPALLGTIHRQAMNGSLAGARKWPTRAEVLSRLRARGSSEVGPRLSKQSSPLLSESSDLEVALPQEALRIGRDGHRIVLLDDPQSDDPDRVVNTVRYLRTSTDVSRHLADAVSHKRAANGISEVEEFLGPEDDSKWVTSISCPGLKPWSSCGIHQKVDISSSENRERLAVAKQCSADAELEDVSRWEAWEPYRDFCRQFVVVCTNCHNRSANAATYDAKKAGAFLALAQKQ